MANEDELRKRLEAAKKQASSEREKRETAAQPTLEQQVEEAERRARDEAAITAAEAEHGPEKVAALHTPMGTIVLKRPNAVAFKKFQDTEGVNIDELEKLVRPCVVHPSHDRFDAILEELPGVLGDLAKQCSALAGVGRSKLEGKS